MSNPSCSIDLPVEVAFTGDGTGSKVGGQALREGFSRVAFGRVESIIIQGRENAMAGDACLASSVSAA